MEAARKNKYGINTLLVSYHIISMPWRRREDSLIARLSRYMRERARHRRRQREREREREAGRKPESARARERGGAPTIC
jgi:hypothetical protein